MVWQSPVYAVIDRIEATPHGSVAVIVVDNGPTYNVPRRPGWKEGDVFRWNGRGWVKDAKEKRRRLEGRRRELEVLKARDPGGDIQL